jgi:hypothetical protein
MQQERIYRRKKSELAPACADQEVSHAKKGKKNERAVLAIGALPAVVLQELWALAAWTLMLQPAIASKLLLIR